MPTVPALAGRADEQPGTSTLPIALDVAWHGLGDVRRDLLARSPPREPKENSVLVLLGGMVTRHRAGYVMSRMCIPAR